MLQADLLMSSAHSMNARKWVYGPCTKALPSQAFAHESSKVGLPKEEEREGERQERQKADGKKGSPTK